MCLLLYEFNLRGKVIFMDSISIQKYKVEQHFAHVHTNQETITGLL